jgi:hypothetical protein
MKVQEEVLTGDLFKLREILLAESAKLDEMKGEIEKPQWRKMAGEIIASELERKIESRRIRSTSIVDLTAKEVLTLSKL